MRTKSTGLKIRNLGNNAYSVDSPSPLWLLLRLCVGTSKQTGGKTSLITSAMHEFQNAGCMDVIAVISETFDSNRKMMENLNIKREHVCSPNDHETVKRIFDIIEAEREDLQRYRDELERYKELDKHLENAST